MNTIEVRKLAKTYPGGVEAVRGIDFDVAPGEVFGLLGPNGAGKSTTVGMLTTTIVPTSGSARLAGFDVATDPLAVRAMSSVVFQEAVVDRSLTGRRNLDIHARLWGVEQRTAAQRIGDLADALGLAKLLDREVGGYNGRGRRPPGVAPPPLSPPRGLLLPQPPLRPPPPHPPQLPPVLRAPPDPHQPTNPPPTPQH